jgi:hypothetical protein
MSGFAGMMVAMQQPIVSSNLITDNLLFNLDMQNYVSGTTWPDASGNGNNFTFYATPTVVNTGTSTAYWSSPGNNGAVAASAIFPANTNYSKGVVFLYTGAAFNNLIGSTTQETFWGANSTFLQAGNNNGDGYQVVSSNPNAVTANTWTYVSMNFSGTTGWTLYINGVARGSSATTTNRSAASTPQIFSYSGNANQTIGKCAAAHLYTRTLSADEHLQNYNYYATRYSGSTPA